MNGHIHRALGLTDDEAAAIEAILGREPNHLELAMYSVMWSEHCSYKSSRRHLSRLPTDGPRVLVGPGENAGVVDAGGGLAVALRIESHNHPSAIEPYQGAATGVGGILRDIFTMGARPIAILDPLRFGPPSLARNRWIATGVVAGISGYGNSVGVPTVGGEIVFDDCYADNPLVNVMCCGVLPKDRLVLGRASGVGNLAVLLGSRTGRDGIGGVSVLASAGFGSDPDTEAAKRPNVQVGDPYEEKRLIEACLQLLDERLVVGIQDLGGAGLTCATSETASRGGVGMDVDVSAVPRREPGLEPWEVMTSESQERMLAIVTPDSLARVQGVCAKWEVAATVVGRVTGTGRLRVLDGWEGPVLADVPAASLHEDAPLYDRPMSPRARPEMPIPPVAEGADPEADLLALLVDPAWVYRQYDHQLFRNTILGPGQADATLLRLSAPGARPAGGRRPAIALSTDGNHRWCALDPRRGTALVVAESALNVACVGAEPVALVNCLNFGNPEHPEVMWELSEAVDGMAEACRGLGLPVIGGNVSLYNESAGRDIDPTPVVGVLGLVDHLERRPPGMALAAGDRLVLLEPPASRPSLAGCRWAAERADRPGHAAPSAAGPARPALSGELAPLDLDAHRRLIDLVRTLAGEGSANGVHDVSDGGLLLALAEMALTGGVGFDVDLGPAPGPLELWGEAPSRVLLSLPPAVVDPVAERAATAGLSARELGRAGGDRLVVRGAVDLSIEAATGAWRGALRRRLDPAASE
jgi:phosphoribosylformylglycinamidine synthase II